MSAQMHLQKDMRVKNRAPAPVQITVEQIMADAQAFTEAPPPPADISITNTAEMDEYRVHKRTEFETKLRNFPSSVPAHLLYARWEEAQGDFTRARSVYERGLAVANTSIKLWLAYVHTELRAGHVNHARNVLDRGVQHMPREDKLWLAWVGLEESVQNIAGARGVWERWMAWNPAPSAWHAYARFEARAGSEACARAVYERLVLVHATPASYQAYAEWEERGARPVLARRVWERALTELPPDLITPQLVAEFAQFETRCQEVERARHLFTAGMEQFKGKPGADALARAHTAFEKRHGSRSDIAAVIIAQREKAYEATLANDPADYDTWFDWLRMEEGRVAGPQDEAGIARVRQLYARATTAIPPVLQQRAWHRYVYLWVRWAAWEEVDAGDAAAAREVWRSALKVIPHAQFTFPEVWLGAAWAQVRAHAPDHARALLGAALGKCPHVEVLRGYITLERCLGAHTRVRKLHERWLELDPAAADGWLAYAAYEMEAGRIDRARGIFELALSPEGGCGEPQKVWRAYIDAEMEAGEDANVAALYERLIQQHPHVRVWLSYALWAGSSGQVDLTREVFRKAVAWFKSAQADADRATMLAAWLKYERARADGDDTDDWVAKVQGMQPSRTVRKRVLEEGETDATGTGWVEEWKYVFPGDATKAQGLALLQAAQRRSRAKREAAAAAAAAAAAGVETADPSASAAAPQAQEPAPEPGAAAGAPQTAAEAGGHDEHAEDEHEIDLE